MVAFNNNCIELGEQQIDDEGKYYLCGLNLLPLLFIHQRMDPAN